MDGNGSVIRDSIDELVKKLGRYDVVSLRVHPDGRYGLFREIRDVGAWLRESAVNRRLWHRAHDESWFDRMEDEFSRKFEVPFVNESYGMGPYFSKL